MQINVQNDNNRINKNNDNSLIKSELSNQKYDGSGYKAYSAHKNNEIFGVDALFEKNEQGEKVYDDQLVYSNKSKTENVSKNEEKSKALAISESINTLNEMITPEGYSKLSELDIIPDKDDPEASVGVYERIQLELATHCEDYTTYINVDQDKLEAVTGSTAFAVSVKKAMDVKENSKPVTLQEEESPTIDNVYKEIYSKSGAKNAYNAESENLDEKQWEELLPQVEKLLDKAGLKVNEENLNMAKWMVSNNIPLNDVNIKKAVDVQNALKLDENEFAQSIYENIKYTMYFTGSTKNASIVPGQYNTKNIDEYVKAINNITDNQIDNIVKQDKTLNFLNIKMEMESADIAQINIVDGDNLKFVEAKKTIIEAQLYLTSKSLLMMKSMGVDVDITSMDKMIEEIKNIENQFVEKMLTSAGASVNEISISNYIGTMQAVENIKTADEGMLAYVSASQTLSYVSQTAINYTNQTYESNDNNEKLQTNVQVSRVALYTYEAVGTKVRADLGDNINKAFANVDEILEGMNLEINEYNRKAVRILGYNSMEINNENIEAVKEIASEMDSLIENITPKTVSHLIAKGINPMDENIADLNEQLVQINEEIGATSENFAKYLWNLDKNNAISEEDRTKFIEMYRSLNAIGKSDFKAIGAALNSGYTMTLNSLLTAAKSEKVAGRVRLDADYIPKIDDTDTEETYEEMKISQLESVGVVSESQVKELLNHNIPVSYSNILNAKALKKEAKIMEKLRGAEKLSEKLGSEEEAKQAYEDLEIEVKEQEKQMVEEGYPSYESIEEAINNTSLVKLLNGFAKESSYFVPVNVGGEMTNIHLTIESGSDTSALLVELNNEMMGKVTMEMNYDGTSLNGIIVCGNIDKTKLLENIAEEFTQTLQQENIKISSLNVSSSKTYIHKSNVATEDKMDTSTLYKCAKIFISQIKTY